MRLLAILSVATLLPLVLATATPLVDDPCDGKCQPILDEFNRCMALGRQNSEAVVWNCICYSSVIRSNFHAYVTPSSPFIFIFIVVPDSNYNAHVAVVPVVRGGRISIISRNPSQKNVATPPTHLIQRQR